MLGPQIESHVVRPDPGDVVQVLGEPRADLRQIRVRDSVGDVDAVRQVGDVLGLARLDLIPHEPLNVRRVPIPVVRVRLHHDLVVSLVVGHLEGAVADVRLRPQRPVLRMRLHDIAPQRHEAHERGELEKIGGGVLQAHAQVMVVHRLEAQDRRVGALHGVELLRPLQEGEHRRVERAGLRRQQGPGVHEVPRRDRRAVGPLRVVAQIEVIREPVRTHLPPLGHARQHRAVRARVRQPLEYMCDDRPRDQLRRLGRIDALRLRRHVVNNRLRVHRRFQASLHRPARHEPSGCERGDQREESWS
jgi:hypothetical protein